MSDPIVDAKAIGLEHNGRQADHPVSPLFLGRWSPRAFTGELIPVETLLTIFEAARWAPSASNSQPWRFVYARRDTPAWESFLSFLVPYNQSWAHAASALVVVLSKATFTSPGKTETTTSWTASFDTGAAWASLAFQAYKLGWAAHGMGGFNHDAARGVIRAPEEYRLEAVVAIGKRGEPTSLPERLQANERPNTRRPLTETVFEGELR
jgi:nitroreductase